ncbi:MAG: TraM recognition domain-containing protein [Pseudomonadota bacterium]
MWMRIGDRMRETNIAVTVFFAFALAIHVLPSFIMYADVLLLVSYLYYKWLKSYDRTLTFKLPLGSSYKDKKNKRNGKAEGILYIGNTDSNGGEEVWFSNSDARTHALYLGTTGSGKTEGLKSMVTNALCWASGYVYIDGKADTDLWSSLSALVRRFGRDDDLLVLNYMTGNSDMKAPSNSMNPFSSGSASYLTNMLVSLMPEAEGDNAMWKERAVSLIGSMMPALTWKRDNQDIPLSVGSIRNYLALNNIIKLARDQAVPEHLRRSVEGYLDTLPGFSAAAFDDEGREKPAGPGQPMIDTTTARQQHGYLAMQFTRSLQSLGDDYGYIFDTQSADIDMIDVVLNRRILVALLPALEKSSDEIANLGKIISATLKGMMGSTLGATVEGDSATVIENKPTHSATPFMTVFDEVGYYTASGMAVMAAQARSLGFSLIFSAQDLPALEKRVKEEARSITANCNIKIFGKLEDPTQTKEFLEKTVGSSFVTEMSGFSGSTGAMGNAYFDNQNISIQSRGRASYGATRRFKEGMAVVAFSDDVADVQFFYANPGFAKAMRVTRYMALPLGDENIYKHLTAIRALRDNMMKKNWTATKADVAVASSQEIRTLADMSQRTHARNLSGLDGGIYGVVGVHAIETPIDWDAPSMPQISTTAAANAPEPVTPPAAIAAPVTAQPPVLSSHTSTALDADVRAVIKDAALAAHETLFRNRKTAATS